jgi:hypothetical protein
MTTDPLPAHSLAEAYFYLMATPCVRCGAGPLHGGDARPDVSGDRLRLTIPVRCGRCGHQQEYQFTISGDLAQLQAQREERVPWRTNPTDSPSEIIDVAQWIILFRVITEAAAKEKDKVEARRLGYEAAQCLEEALRFYEEDNDLPPDGAFFHESSRAMGRDNPHEFSRERLIGLRAKLPSLEAMEASQRRARKGKKRWWMPWR